MNPNKPATVSQRMAGRPDATTNHEGGLAFKPGTKTKLYLRGVTWMFGEPQFYGTDADADRALVFEAVAEDPRWVLNLASYCRNEMHLRTAPQLMLAAVAVRGRGLAGGSVRRACRSIMRRPDDMLSCLAFVRDIMGDIGDGQAAGSLPSGLKKGMADCMRGWTPYQLKKWSGAGRMITLADAVKLCHPQPHAKNGQMPDTFRQIIEGTMPIPETWETIVSAGGSNRDAWVRAAAAMPYMASVRNLRNLLLHRVDINEICDNIMHPGNVVTSKMLPHQFYSAYRAVQDMPSDSVHDAFAKDRALHALAHAIDYSAANIPKMSGVTAAFADYSRSMAQPVSRRSTVTLRDVAALFGASMAKRNKTVFGAFGVECRLMDTQSTIVDLVRFDPDVGHATNAYLCLDVLCKTEIDGLERVMIFSDEQTWDTRHFGTLNRSFQDSYRRFRAMHPDAKLYLVDLAGHGTLLLPEGEENVYNLGGYSDRIFDAVRGLESDPSYMQSMIAEYGHTDNARQRD